MKSQFIVSCLMKVFSSLCSLKQSSGQKHYCACKFIHVYVGQWLQFLILHVLSPSFCCLLRVYTGVFVTPVHIYVFNVTTLLLWHSPTVTVSNHSATQFHSPLTHTMPIHCATSNPQLMLWPRSTEHFPCYCCFLHSVGLHCSSLYYLYMSAMTVRHDYY